MVSTYQMPTYFRPNPLTVDTSQAQKYYEEEDHSILDENILDHSALDSGLEMSPPMADSRRESFAVGGSLFSPKTEDWQSVEMQSVPSNNPFHMEQHSNNPFMRLDHAQPSPFGPQGNAWSLSNTSGSCTPLQQFDGMPAEYDNSALFQRPTVQGQTPFTNPTGQINMFASIGSGNQSIPTSPQKGWIGQAESMAKKMRPGSPTIRSHNDMRRGDGIRKKNARFDIPAERNLSNIDQLIAQSTDEQEIKELKQQKRLLRNRQAALDSRQRKKQHTERLEDEKKQFTAVLTDMEEEMAEMRQKMEQLLREKQFQQEYIESVTMEKEEMIRTHTIETGELRKKVSVLTEHVQRLESAAMAAPPSNAFVSGYDDMDGMTMPGTWDNVNFLGEYPMEQQQQQQPEVKQELQVVPAKKTEVPFPVDADKPSSSQGGILFMLFLVGAFVLSSRSTPAIPRVSEDVRAEAATLLENVFKDAGVNEASNTLNAVAPQPSGGSWVVDHQDATMSGVAPSMLGQLGDTLTQPTEEQANEQLFGLSAAQYNGVSSQDFLSSGPTPAERATSQGRRNLADALAAMRNSNKQSAAEVYTRSLLWDQIPSEVVRNFAKMVSESNKDE